ncbi:MAG: preprotein translocase, partial [Rhizobiales bacterium]|nr:preprotein translocase [Hyphomicrobiales bacterium]
MADAPEEQKLRSEQDIFDELATVCQRPGFAHAIATFCFRDNIVGYGDKLKGEDYAKMFSSDRLIRTEISTLIGLMARAPIDWAKPSNENIEHMLKQAEALLQELHIVLNRPGEENFKAMMEGEDANPFKAGSFLREPIFYAAESAYASQYRDFA